MQFLNDCQWTTEFDLLAFLYALLRSRMHALMLESIHGGSETLMRTFLFGMQSRAMFSIVVSILFMLLA